MTDPTNSKRKVLVTGASGFIGLHTVSKLLNAGRQVIATATYARDSLPSHPNLVWSIWDSTKENLPDVDWHGIDSIVHLIMPATLVKDVSRAKYTFDVVAASTQHLLDAAATGSVRRFLLASTGDVLGGRSEPAQETDVSYNPETYYGSSKACAELITNAYKPNLSTAILRFYHPYGPGGEKFLISNLVRRIRNGQKVFLQGADGIIINPVWIEEMVEGIASAINSEGTGIFHLGGPDFVSMREVIEQIGDLLGRQPVIETSDARPNNFYCGDRDRSQKLLNFSPSVGIGAGLEMLVNQSKLR